MKNDISKNVERLRKNSYSGRGIVMGLNKSGDSAVQVYWVMGRSENSRNRILVEQDNVVRTVPFDESKVEDPSLIIYNALVQVGDSHIVSNGDQIDTIANGLSKQQTMEESLKSRTYESDEPNYTPRISGVVKLRETPEFTFGIIRREDSPEPIRQYFTFSKEIEKGMGHCIHTYKEDGNPLPSFDSEPYIVPLGESANEIAKFYWNLLNKENRVGIVAKIVDLKTKKVDFTILNQL
ncbi:hypothetical protein A3G67_04365 [Candidatus Roizmanbacteria bacterium RIFCSPLOWO2_12_FULL_40_12]|uniref:Inosine monophosphate cyclohydrolase-like domain-containing protein n=1 Tax=Candidatus Roizmanbacteria bacterium RIFCSPLOWO2_01_FULL_40_42 TaxID=1802066 RepID=A0A1F7J4T1_9BACT|nr:MAG: hypothetical protein A2779_04785 [Candidatus Roizmanbacteria bacterium RIFCSPHIGHO2_01_FULL_40_98]OGK27387.1 MAG: hypothetical protein A3C31_05110 [Candidatus Roizmanbacteria bacterium RIFCSPHIGHO2_02_FULL_40_53]OGK30740.1 MAG: hypothetical protein A2W49_01930 [Candidatus Roizmanbacteria bacterium RIFCSPHIGHO2_12_41_18]OGK36190.1 MAG: hypothetical protein A3E69_01410 [Candidatus Roizmanbacteria bacterium RIFCSPHIGHO2_12_FULL_40_130]OGK50621.1 MAG: hypothetical protein A3B50_02465 [Candi